MPKRGALHHFAKLTDSQVREMRVRYAEGKTSYWKLAMDYGIDSTDTIGKIIRRETWTHL